MTREGIIIGCMVAAWLGCVALAWMATRPYRGQK